MFMFCGGLIAQPKALVIDEIIAIVGNSPILKSELDILATQLDPDIKITDEVKCELFQTLLLNKLMVHQAEIDSIPLKEEEITDRIENNMRFFERQMNNRENIERYLGMSIEEYKRQIFPKLKNQMLQERMEAQIKREIKITPKEVRDFYNKIPSDSLPYISSEVEIGVLKLKPKYSKEAKEIAYEQLQELKSRVEAGESFARLAGLYSNDPGSANQGGLLPEFGRGDMVPEFERTAFAMKKDSLSEIIETPYGYHVLKLINRRGERAMVRHILIRPRLIDTDIAAVKQKADSIYDLLSTGKTKWCEAVNKFSEDEESKPFCGFLIDQNIGSQKIPFDYLDKDMSKIASTLKPGEFNKPEISYAPDGSPFIRIIYLKDETKPHTANLENDWQRIQSLALEEKKEREIEVWAAKRRKETYIFIKKEYFDCDFYEVWVNLLKN